MYMMYPHYYYNNGGIFGFGILPIFIILGVIFLVWAIFAHRSDSRDTELDDEELRETRETAMEILKKRYARGEITKRQYLEMKKDIA